MHPSGNRVGSRLWFGDVRRLLLTNLLAYAGKCWLITITAPGVDVLPWACITRGCEGAQRKRQEGEPKGCCVVCGESKVEPHAAHEWNRTAARRWSELHRWAMQATARAGHDLRTLARVWQLQERGVLHVHLVEGVESPAEHAAARYYVACLRSRTREFGFGFIDARDKPGKTGRPTVMEPHRAAGYLAHYLGESSQLVKAIALDARPQRLVWISPRLTLLTGCTRRRLRRARFLWSLRNFGPGVLRYAGALPRWICDPLELSRVQGLLTSAAPAGP